MRFIILTLSAENAVTIYFKSKSKPSYFDPPTFPSTTARRQRKKANEESPLLACSKLETKPEKSEVIKDIKTS